LWTWRLLPTNNDQQLEKEKKKREKTRGEQREDQREESLDCELWKWWICNSENLEKM
jgi:hypothetical protein